VTGVHENGVLNGGICSTIGLGPGERSDRVGFTFEAGEHTNPENAVRAWAVTQRLLAAFGLWSDAPPVEEGLDFEVYEVVDRFRQAPAGTVQYRFVGYEGGEAGERRWGAPRKLHSFEQVQADEVVLRRGHDAVVRAASPYTMLMPAPNTAPGTDLSGLWRCDAPRVCGPPRRASARGVQSILFGERIATMTGLRALTTNDSRHVPRRALSTGSRGGYEMTSTQRNLSVNHHVNRRRSSGNGRLPLQPPRIIRRLSYLPVQSPVHPRTSR
jgi:hypothetical protein